MQHDGRRAEPWMKKVTVFCVAVGGRKGFAREHQNWFFRRLRNESTLTMLLVEISTESIYRYEYLCRSGCVGVSDVPSAHVGMQSSTAVLQWGNDVASMPHHPDDVACMPHHLLTRFDESSGLWYTSSVWPYAGHAQSTYFYSTEIWLTSSTYTVFFKFRISKSISKYSQKSLISSNLLIGRNFRANFQWRHYYLLWLEGLVQ
jgi:hypothetical protein